MATEIQRLMPSQNRLINWLQRDSQGAYNKSGYRKNLVAIIIDRKVETSETS